MVCYTARKARPELLGLAFLLKKVLHLVCYGLSLIMIRTRGAVPAHRRLSILARNSLVSLFTSLSRAARRNGHRREHRGRSSA